MVIGFKPCYKWITFNISFSAFSLASLIASVLNLVINGLPSIYEPKLEVYTICNSGFKPCYKWITFNILFPVSK